MSNPTIFTTGAVAEQFNKTPKQMRRVMRAVGVACGSGARHSFTKPEFENVVAKCAERMKVDNPLKAVKSTKTPRTTKTATAKAS